MNSKLSRRQFLRTGALASASVAVSLGFAGCERALLNNIRASDGASLPVYAERKSAT